MKDDTQWIEYGKTGALGVFRFLMLLMSMRVVPFFTTRKFPNIKIETPEILKKTILVVAFLLIILDLLPDQEREKSLFYFISVIPLTLQFFHWKPWKSYQEPMIIILHFGYLWIITHLILTALSLLHEPISYGQAHLHSLTAGAMGAFTLGIMCRASLGHTGYPIKADKWILLIFLSVLLGAVIRVFVPLFFPDYYTESMHHASGWWTFAYMIYFIRFFKPLIVPRKN